MMAASSQLTRLLPLLLLVVWPHYAAVSAGRHDPPMPPCAPCFERLFSLGDSVTDAGNLASVAPNLSVLAFPYGETFFHRPTGRFCDGRLIVDFIVRIGGSIHSMAEALKLPFQTPFLAGKTAADFRQGANFAVSGATALSQQFFRDMGLDLTILPPFSLDVQLEWFKQVRHLLGATEQERQDIMSRSLFLLGEIGINDYNHPFFQNRSFVDEIRPLVPKVIKKIENATKVLIGLGAKTIVVPGTIPMGCIPRYLTLFQSANPGDYDAAGCIRWLNDFAEEHNCALRRMLEQGSGRTLRRRRAPQLGDSHRLQRHVGCPNPSRHISWDGVHLTEAAYQFVARGVLDGPYAAPPILSKRRC
ncbi:unnamed protein product [Urochloa decumbens]|uniref:GDSL esterase/lipase n=1 Tax=Urochloa decumbens TaxID=240449 RepID=A0ABC8XW53_9POAL